MKKLLAIVLVLVLVMASAVTVFAEVVNIESVSDPNNLKEKDVNIIITPATGGADVYKVTLTWDALDFNYAYRDSGTWDPDNHVYTDTEAAGWKGATSATINLKNHSNADVNVTVEFERVTVPDGAVFTEDTIADTKQLVYKGVTCVMENTVFSLDAVAGTGLEAVVDEDNITITVSGTPTETSGTFRMDTVRVTIAPKY